MVHVTEKTVLSPKRVRKPPAGGFGIQTVPGEVRIDVQLEAMAGRIIADTVPFGRPKEVPLGKPRNFVSFFPKAGEGSFHAVVAFGYVDITNLESHVGLVT